MLNFGTCENQSIENARCGSTATIRATRFHSRSIGGLVVVSAQRARRLYEHRIRFR
jgi:hypothetical protein